MAEEQLTPRELRLLALLLEGQDQQGGFFGPSEQAALGTEVEDIRRKLGVGEGESLLQFIQERFGVDRIGSDDEDSDENWQSEERRLRLLLRATITELLNLSRDAELRTGVLRATFEHLGGEESEVSEEIEDLEYVAKLIRQAADQALEHTRSRGPRSSVPK